MLVKIAVNLPKKHIKTDLKEFKKLRSSIDEMIKEDEEALKSKKK
jgi:hypothetical protein